MRIKTCNVKIIYYTIPTLEQNKLGHEYFKRCFFFLGTSTMWVPTVTNQRIPNKKLFWKPVPKTDTLILHTSIWLSYILRPTTNIIKNL